MRKSPVVLLGISNDWLQKLDLNVRFRARRDADPGRRWIQDVNDPENMKWQRDTNISYNEAKHDYAVITRVYDLETGQWIVCIAGLSGPGTQISAESIIDKQWMANAVHAFPRGWENKNLQIVLKMSVLQGSPTLPTVESFYVW